MFPNDVVAGIRLVSVWGKIAFNAASASPVTCPSTEAIQLFFLCLMYVEPGRDDLHEYGQV